MLVLCLTKYLVILVKNQELPLKANFFLNVFDILSVYVMSDTEYLVVSSNTNRFIGNYKRSDLK